MVRISINLGKKAFLLLNEEAGRRKAEGLPRNKKGEIMEDALIGLLAGKTGRIRILSDVSPYKGLDGKEYGPFKFGEVVELPIEEIQWLVKEKLAEMKAEVEKDG